MTSLALLLDAGSRVPDGAETVLREAGFEVTREPCAKLALSRLFLDAHDLVVIGHWPPSIDAHVILRALRRQPDCASRRATIVVALVQANRAAISRYRQAGVSFVHSVPVGEIGMHRILEAMRADSRQFVESPSYVGPDRRVQTVRWRLLVERRAPPASCDDEATAEPTAPVPQQPTTCAMPAVHEDDPGGSDPMPDEAGSTPAAPQTVPDPGAAASIRRPPRALQVAAAVSVRYQSVVIRLTHDGNPVEVELDERTTAVQIRPQQRILLGPCPSGCEPALAWCGPDAPLLTSGRPSLKPPAALASAMQRGGLTFVRALAFGELAVRRVADGVPLGLVRVIHVGGGRLLAQIERAESMGAKGGFMTTARRFPLAALDTAVPWLMEAGMARQRQLAACAHLCYPPDQPGLHLGTTRWRDLGLALVQSLADGSCFLRADPPPLDAAPLAEIYRGTGRLYAFRTRTSDVSGLSAEAAIQRLIGFIAGGTAFTTKQRRGLLAALANDGASWMTAVAGR